MYKGGIFQLRLTITFLGVSMNIVMMVILSPWPDKRFQGGFYSFYLEIIIIWLRKSVFFTIIIMKIMNHKWCKLLLFNFDDGENIYQRLLQLQIHITYCSRLNLTQNDPHTVWPIPQIVLTSLAPFSNWEFYTLNVQLSYV